MGYVMMIKIVLMEDDLYENLVEESMDASVLSCEASHIEAFN
jgi:hypothetical protein